MPPHKRPKGPLVVIANERLQQGAVGLFARPLVCRQLPDTQQDCPRLRRGHCYLSPHFLSGLPSSARRRKT